MRLYLIRHGETVLNRKRCYYGLTDADLSETGLGQAKAVAKLLEPVAFDRVISSPLTRAVRTAGLVTEGRNPDIAVDERLCEQNFGVFEAKTYEELIRDFPEEMEAWNRNYNDYRIPGGESFADVRARADDFAGMLRREADGDAAGQTWLICAHKGTLGHLTASLLAMPLSGYWNFVFEQDCFSVIDLEDGFAIIRSLNRR